MSDDDGIPESVQNAIFDFHEAITNVEETLQPFLSKPLEQIESQEDPLGKARIELMSIFAANSLHWMYLCTHGECPTEHPVLDELNRIKKYMDRLKELEDRPKAPKLNKQAAKSFIRSALWEPNSNNQESEQHEDLNHTATTTSSNNFENDSAESSTSRIAQEFNDVLRQMKEASNEKASTAQVAESMEVDQTIDLARETGSETKKKRRKKKGDKGKKSVRFQDDAKDG